MKNKAVNRFCRRVGRHLQCMPATRAALLQGLAEELSELPQEDTASASRLEAQVGKPAAVAAALQESVPPEEQARVIRRRWILLVLVIVLVLCVSASMLILANAYFDGAPAYFTETITEGTW